MENCNCFLNITVLYVWTDFLKRFPNQFSISGHKKKQYLTIVVENFGRGAKLIDLSEYIIMGSWHFFFLSKQIQKLKNNLGKYLKYFWKISRVLVNFWIYLEKKEKAKLPMVMHWHSKNMACSCSKNVKNIWNVFWQLQLFLKHDSFVGMNGFLKTFLNKSCILSHKKDHYLNIVLEKLDRGTKFIKKSSVTFFNMAGRWKKIVFSQMSSVKILRSSSYLRKYEF